MYTLNLMLILMFLIDSDAFSGFGVLNMTLWSDAVNFVPGAFSDCKPTVVREKDFNSSSSLFTEAQGSSLTSQENIGAGAGAGPANG